jgi:hypothetical protein
MASATDFAKFVPGFDFLQGLMRSAGQALPDMGKWVAPTLDPEELGQRIEQLKTVQAWLEHNARMLGATVQALEVQRMTLATLKSMNVPVADLGQALKARPPEPPASPTGPAPAAADPAPAVDPMQWWGALTQQFTQLAAQALKEGPVEAARNAAGQFAQAAARSAAKAPAPAPGKPAAGAPRSRRPAARAPARAPRSKQT